MKSKIGIMSSVILAFVFCVSMTSCSYVGSETVMSKDDGDSTNPIVGRVDSKMDYSIIKDNGSYLIVFDDITLYESNPQQLASIEFSSMRAFKDAVTKGTLTESQKGVIATAFEKNDRGEVLACDFDNLFIPQVPASVVTESVWWGGGNSYSFQLSSDESIFGTFHYLTENQYSERYRRDYVDLFSKENVHVLETATTDNKEIIYYDTLTGTLKNVRHILSVNGKTLVIDKTYRLHMDNTEIETSAGVPSSIKMYGVEDEEWYIVTLYGFEEDPTDEWLMGFGIEKYIDFGRAPAQQGN